MITIAAVVNRGNEDGYLGSSRADGSGRPDLHPLYTLPDIGHQVLCPSELQMMFPNLPKPRSPARNIGLVRREVQN